MSVVSVKVPEEVRREMKRHEDKVNWPEGIRRFITDTLEEINRAESIAGVERLLANEPTLPEGTASRLVRQDRDSGH